MNLYFEAHLIRRTALKTYGIASQWYRVVSRHSSLSIHSEKSGQIEYWSIILNKIDLPQNRFHSYKHCANRNLVIRGQSVAAYRIYSIKSSPKNDEVKMNWFHSDHSYNQQRLVRIPGCWLMLRLCFYKILLLKSGIIRRSPSKSFDIRRSPSKWFLNCIIIKSPLWYILPVVTYSIHHHKIVRTWIKWSIGLIKSRSFNDDNAAIFAWFGGRIKWMCKRLYWEWD